MPRWVGKHPRRKLFMIQSSSLESQRWRRVEIKDINPTVLNGVRHPFNLALFISHAGRYQTLPGQHLRRASAWRYLPAVVSHPPAGRGSAVSSPLLSVGLEPWNLPPCLSPEDYLLWFVNLSELFCSGLCSHRSRLRLQRCTS